MPLENCVDSHEVRLYGVAEPYAVLGKFAWNTKSCVTHGQKMMPNLQCPEDDEEPWHAKIPTSDSSGRGRSTGGNWYVRGTAIDSLFAVPDEDEDGLPRGKIQQMKTSLTSALHFFSHPVRYPAPRADYQKSSSSTAVSARRNVERKRCNTQDDRLISSKTQAHAGKRHVSMPAAFNACCSNCSKNEPLATQRLFHALAPESYRSIQEASPPKHRKELLLNEDEQPFVHYSVYFRPEYRLNTQLYNTSRVKAPAHLDLKRNFNS
eukprot:GEMP01051693.1.p2 GENE.GEMP01051693.1~~GEMP01051693.1.p2  ORF type:complete len:264 (+),score=43.65 GEMP01051693.1:192-983(+)